MKQVRLDLGLCLSVVLLTAAFILFLIWYFEKKSYPYRALSLIHI